MYFQDNSTKLFAEREGREDLYAQKRMEAPIIRRAWSPDDLYTTNLHRENITDSNSCNFEFPDPETLIRNIDIEEAGNVGRRIYTRVVTGGRREVDTERPDSYSLCGSGESTMPSNLLYKESWKKKPKEGWQLAYERWMARGEDGSPTKPVSHHSTWTIEGELLHRVWICGDGGDETWKNKKGPARFPRSTPSHESCKSQSLRVREDGATTNVDQTRNARLELIFVRRVCFCDERYELQTHRDRIGATTTTGRTNGGTFRRTCVESCDETWLKEGSRQVAAKHALAPKALKLSNHWQRERGRSHDERGTNEDWMIGGTSGVTCRICEDAFLMCGAHRSSSHHVLLYHSCSFLVCKQPPFTCAHYFKLEVKYHMSLSYWLRHTQNLSHCHCKT